ncbi:OPT oligopeptide transporter protein-domain-containing protein [Lipomyces kononenkoae]
MDKITKLINVSSEDEKDNLYEFDVKFQAVLIGYVSPYPEVRSVVDATDDPTIPVETFRVYLLGFFFIIVVSAVNQFFTTRQPHISISAAIVQILVFPCGKTLAKALPDWGFTLRGTRYSLNPGQWTFKEQMLAYIMMGGSLSATNLIGMGLAGTMRRFAVYPTRCVWPTNLAGIAMNRALVKSEKRTIVHALSTFNLAVISVINQGFGPLTSPFYTSVNRYIGMYTAYMPINSNILMTNTGATFDNYSPPFYSAGALFNTGSN